MVDEVKRHGVFKEFSAYEYESFMNTIKNTLHNHSLPLQQLHRRIVEIFKSQLAFSEGFRNNTKVKFGKTMKVENENVYSHVWCSKIYFSTEFKDSWFMTKAKEIVKINKIVSESKYPKFSVSKLSAKEELFELPMPSSFLHIYKGILTNLVIDTEIVQPSDLKCKLFCIRIKPNYEEFAFFPMSDMD